MKSLMLAASLALGFAAVTPASAAMPSTAPLSKEVGSLAETVAWYCNGRGHCVQGPRAGYVVRNGWAPGCVGGLYWDGYRCARRGAVVVAPGPAVVVAPPKVVIRP